MDQPDGLIRIVAALVYDTRSPVQLFDKKSNGLITLKLDTKRLVHGTW